MSSFSRSGLPRWILLAGRRCTTAALALALVGVGCSSEFEVTVAVQFNGDGGGEVDWFDTGQHSCTHVPGELGEPCFPHSFPDADGKGVITFSETPDGHSVFAGWSIASCGTEPDCLYRWTERPAGDIEVAATFLLVPTAVKVTLSDETPLEPGATIQATATAMSPIGGTLEDVEYTWASSNPTVATITGSGAQVTVTALEAGTTDITASTRGVPSDPVTVTVAGAGAETQLAYTHTEFVTVPDAYNLDLDTDGNIFVGNTGASDRSTLDALVRKVTPDGRIASFGEPVADPDVVFVDAAGRISTLGPNTVLTAGAYDTQFNKNHVTEINAIGSVTQPLIEDKPPLLSNPGALALLPNGDLLVGNFGNNTISRVHRDAGGTPGLTEFYRDTEAPTSFYSMAVVDDVVYAVTGSRRLTALNVDGGVIAPDIWPSSATSDPLLLAAGRSGPLKGYLIAAGRDGRVWRIDTTTYERVQIGDFVFSGVLGVAVSPVDGVLYVMDGSGTIWKLTEG